MAKGITEVKKIYMKVTDDEYELPIAIADTGTELAEMLGLERTSVYKIIDQAKRNNGNTVYKKVEIDDD